MATIELPQSAGFAENNKGLIDFLKVLPEDEKKSILDILKGLTVEYMRQERSEGADFVEDVKEDFLNRLRRSNAAKYEAEISQNLEQSLKNLNLNTKNVSELRTQVSDFFRNLHNQIR